EPTYKVHESVFYCVANMPGAVPHTSTYALTNVTLPYVLELANLGWRGALRADAALLPGLHTHEGALTIEPVAEAHGLPCTTPEQGLRCPAGAGGPAGTSTTSRWNGAWPGTPWRLTGVTLPGTRRRWRTVAGRTSAT